jgi:hypothetical protein
VTGDDNKNTVKENDGQRKSQDCTIKPKSWQGAQTPASSFDSKSIRQRKSSASNGLTILVVVLDADSATAYKQRIKNVAKTVQTVMMICRRTLLLRRPTAVVAMVLPK